MAPGEILGIVGESGSGKSTVLKAAMGLLENSGVVTRGEIYYKGQNVTDSRANELRKLPPETGVIIAQSVEPIVTSPIAL